MYLFLFILIWDSFISFERKTILIIKYISRKKAKLIFQTIQWEVYILIFMSEKKKEEATCLFIPCLCVVCLFRCTPKDVVPMDRHSHVYEEVRDDSLYQDILASSPSSPPPLFDHRLPHQRNGWRSPAHPQVRKLKKTKQNTHTHQWWELLFYTWFILVDNMLQLQNKWLI